MDVETGISSTLQIKIWQENLLHFRKMDLEVLLPFLNEKHMITLNDMEYFSLTSHTSQVKLDKLFVIIPKNGSNFLYEFISILRKSYRKSHDEFAASLEGEINKVQGKMGRSLSSPIPESTSSTIPRRSYTNPSQLKMNSELKPGASNSLPIGDVSSVEANNEAAVVDSTCTSSKFEYINTEGMSEAERDSFRGRLEFEYDNIVNRFSSLHYPIYRSLIDNEVAPDELLASLRGMRVSCIREEKFFDYKDLEECDTVKKIFYHLVDHYLSFFSFDILKHIVSKFNIKSEVKSELEAYETELEEYCRRNVFECPWNKDGKKQSCSINLVMKIDDVDKTVYTLRSLRRLCASVAKILSIPNCLEIGSISKGCIEITFSLPEFISVHIFPLNLDQIEALSGLGVCRLKCGKWSYDDMRKERTLQVNADISNTQSQEKYSRQDSHMCIQYYLQGACRLGHCDYNHDRTLLSDPFVDYIPFPDPRPSRSPIGKKGRDPSGKCYMIIESDRSPELEVKVIADAKTAIDHAKEVTFGPSFQERALKPQRSICEAFSLLDMCSRGDSCRKQHRVTGRRYEDYVLHPIGRVLPADKKSTEKYTNTRSGGYFFATPSDRNPDKEIRVIADSEESLIEGMSAVKLHFNRELLSASMCYIHPYGVEVHNAALKLCKLKPQNYTLQLIESEDAKVATVSDFLELNRDDYKLERISIEQRTNLPTFNINTRITWQYYDEIHKKIKGDLMRIDKERIPKIEGRFGKLVWINIPSDYTDSRGVKIESFVHFLFKHRGYKRRFESRVNNEDVTLLEQSGIMHYTGSLVKTYDFKLSIKNRGKVDIRVQFVLQKPSVIGAKEENKSTILDILCFNRKHDMRFCLSHYSVIPSDDPVITKFISTCSLSESGMLSFDKGNDSSECQVRLVRYKQRKAYHLKNIPRKYVLSVTTVHSYEAKPDSELRASVFLPSEDITPHFEIELHNLVWESTFQAQHEQNPSKALALIIEEKYIPPEIMKDVQYQWSPDSIMKEFEQEQFIKILEDINYTVNY